MPWEEHLQLHLLPKAPAARGVQEEAGSPEGTNLGRRAGTSLPSCSYHTCSKGSPNHPCAALFPQLCPATHQGSLQKGNHTMDGKTQIKFMVYSGHSVSQRKQATSFETVILCKMALRSCTSLLLPSSSLILHTICAHWSLQALLYFLYCINSCRKNCLLSTQLLHLCDSGNITAQTTTLQHVGHRSGGAARCACSRGKAPLVTLSHPDHICTQTCESASLE